MVALVEGTGKGRLLGPGDETRSESRVGAGFPRVVTLMAFAPARSRETSFCWVQTRLVKRWSSAQIWLRISSSAGVS